MLSPLRSMVSIEKLQRRSLGIVFAILGVLGVSFLAERLTLAYYERNWSAVVEEKSAEQLKAVTRAFVLVQRNARRIAAELARDEVVTSYLIGRSTDLGALFERAARVANRQDVGVEIYDRNGALIAWHGRSGTVDPREIRIALRGELTSYITRGPIFSHLFVITPVRVEGAYYGAVLIRKAVEMNYPLSNKFIRRAGLSEQLSRELGVNVELSYGDEVEPRSDGRYLSTVILGIDGRKLGVASILRLSRSAYLERIAGSFAHLNVALLTILVGFLTLLAVRWLAKQSSLWVRCVSVTVLLWTVRYLLLWLDVPSIFLSMSVFDPGHFASKFGGGLAKSIGDMTLTSMTLFANIAFIAQLVGGRIVHASLWRPRSLPLQLLIGVAITAFIFLSLRGVAAVIRSAVYDSTLRFNDPTVIIPSFELGLMVFNIFVISFCLIMVAVGLTWYLLAMFETGSKRARTPAVGWGAVLALYTAAGFLFQIVQETPLLSIPFRLSFGVAILLFTFYLQSRKGRREASPLAFGNAVVVLALSALFFYPVLYDGIRERDRERVEAIARDVLRPTDAWIKYVVEESLHQFLTDETLDVLLYGSREEIERLPFRCWAMSIAGRQGYNCLFALLTPTGEELSRFAIGEQVAETPADLLDVLDKQGNKVSVHYVGSGVNAVRVYSSSIPIIAADSVLGYGVVTIAVAQQFLFRGEAPTVFRISSQENVESFYRSISLCEFQGDSLVASTVELPLGYKLPKAAGIAFHDSTTVSAWVEEHIGGKGYDAYFVRRPDSRNQFIGLYLERLGLQWHLIGIVRTLIYYAIVLIGSLILVLLIRWVRGDPYHLSFRDKLLIAFVVVALVPIVIIAVYVRTFASERREEQLAERLRQETAQVEQAILDEQGGSAQKRTEALATKMGSDFNYYVGNMLAISSRRELYDTGILDRRLSGSAYAGIFLRGQRFHVEAENIGLYRYAVGYKPLLANDGSIQGVIAVPALYRQEEIEEDVARTNALLFGIYAVIVIVVTVLATTLANRIAAPIHSLTEATKHVSYGDLDVKVRAKADGEIGELIRSFEAMTRDLKQSRENLVQYERELAWKEMAKQVAHEIKNPLTPMKLALQHLQQTYRDKVENFDEIFEEVSQMVIRQVDALSRIASEFSRFARMPKAHLEQCSVNDVLREATSLFEQDKRVTLEEHLDPHLPPIMADREELRRAFINIIRNGVQAMGNQGRIIVATSREGHDIEVRIQDFGSGIPDEVKDKLFQPNFSTKTDGMGLGLAIVKKTIDDLHGSIRIDSKLDEGTTVIIRIPTDDSHLHEQSYHSAS